MTIGICLRAVFLALGLAAIAPAEACTGIKLKAKDGAVVQGRTLEFGIKVDTSVAVIPRGHEFVGSTPKGSGLTYKAKFAAVGAIAFGKPALLDGMNEKGLCVATFYFPGYASYSEISSENQKKALSPVEFSNWLVVSFSTIDEVKAGLSDVVIAPTIEKEWGEAPAPFHYIVFDKSGNALVIEPLKGKLATYDNPLGVLTNSPSFDWHMTNLRNFINLTPFNVGPIQLGGIALAPFGQGSGMVGMPGDFTPPSRFVRAAIFSSTAEPSNDSVDAVFQAFHILHQFDIPVGVTRQQADDVVYTDVTLATVVRDPKELTYYFNTYDDQTIRMVDLHKFDLDGKAIKQLNTATFKQSAVDVSSQLHL